MKKENGVFTGNMNEFFKKGQEIFYKINPTLEKQHHGKVLVIEVESEDYFDENPREAMRKAKAKYPDRIFFRCRAGVGSYQIFHGSPYK